MAATPAREDGGTAGPAAEVPGADTGRFPAYDGGPDEDRGRFGCFLAWWARMRMADWQEGGYL
ncbi:hypothetical protein [Kitasatospora sp. NPDC088346]|uniref:hypothetical protein n=1 Tax=Kitasatospora sp. NPDC088346 TaxID=3364073 RepID=UPI0038051F95